ncbi:MAG TPA: F0F1 ATP synthase subunit epsilon [Rectinemataceae bacterium]|nr:F0F1 ATP synthase subunit epsilon [Rectinemataceae bacterium]
MRLAVSSPTDRLESQGVTKIGAEGPLGRFCLLPRHVDFVSTLVPGLLSFWDAEGKEGLVAVDEGLLVKKGDEVLVSTRAFVAAEALGGIGEAVAARLEALEEGERSERAMLARLEADFMRRFGESK